MLSIRILNLNYSNSCQKPISKIDDCKIHFCRIIAQKTPVHPYRKFSENPETIQSYSSKINKNYKYFKQECNSALLFLENEKKCEKSPKNRQKSITVSKLQYSKFQKFMEFSKHPIPQSTSSADFEKRRKISASRKI
ncbi:unnamed protein product [Caenorhabditis angaria]|uniref:Uncharacterized protein n=1 Tax=Caenorhabditis angaria TaxID=860376 RepID=A0A9P1IGG3_9PELO|nr:unnamed protein product [Caenorhabditis angaria]